MMLDSIHVSACGAAALRVVADTGDRELDWSTVHALAGALDALGGSSGITSIIPTYDSVLVEFDSGQLSERDVEAVVNRVLLQVLGHPASRPNAHHFEVPVVYGGEHGPDLDYVAALEELTSEELIAAHTGKEYVIRCFGAPAASPMMDAPDLPVPVPRLPSPRAAVPAGVVSLAGRQAVIAPAAAPGGWRVIGRTPLVLLHGLTEPLVPYSPGDTLRFYRIDADEYLARLGELMEPRA